MPAACLHILTLIAYTLHAVLGCCLHHHHVSTARSGFASADPGFASTGSGVFMAGHARAGGCCQSRSTARQSRHTHVQQNGTTASHKTTTRQTTAQQQQHAASHQHVDEASEDCSDGNATESYPTDSAPTDSAPTDSAPTDSAPAYSAPTDSPLTPHESHGDAPCNDENDCHEHDCYIPGLQLDRSSLAMSVSGLNVGFRTEECLPFNRHLSQVPLFDVSAPATAKHHCALRQVWRL